MLSLGMLVPIFSLILNPDEQSNDLFMSIVSNFFKEFDQQNILGILFVSFFILFLFKFIFSFLSFTIETILRTRLEIIFQKEYLVLI